jgi:hypothetical protein
MIGRDLHNNAQEIWFPLNQKQNTWHMAQQCEVH